MTEPLYFGKPKYDFLEDYLGRTEDYLEDIQKEKENSDGQDSSKESTKTS